LAELAAQPEQTDFQAHEKDKKMKPTLPGRAATVITGIGLAATMLSVQAHGTESGTARMPTFASSALITIPDPKEASLLQLHG
jgi:hypothetical protein